MSASIPQSNFKFLNDLTANNNRDWFNENKKWYQEEHQNIVNLAEDLLQKLGAIDQIATVSGKKSLMRVYRDVRFSKDKSPYNPRWAGSFGRIKPELRGGYYYHIQPGNTVVGGGFYNPNPDDLKLIRNHIAQDDQPLRSVLNDPAFKKMFGELGGQQVKTAPKGFDKEHPSIDLLRYKSMYVFHAFTDEEATSSDFADKVIEVWKGIRPFFDVMTEILTTDLNGLSLIK
ncbi:MAG: DUF2461 domain-containing protein [Roseivirga sp.]|nr:DUF2461 domain-containing protein [Roseivirga sp.]